MTRQASKAGHAIDEDLRPGEIAGLFIQKIGGKAAFIERIVQEFNTSHQGSMARAKILDAILKDAAEAHSRRTNFEDLDDEDLLEQHLASIEQRVANARLAQTEEGEQGQKAPAPAPEDQPPPASQRAEQDDPAGGRGD